MAHRKTGSGVNGRNSPGQRLGVKVYDGETVTSGSIIVRQRGTKVHPGLNVKRGRDDTLFAVAGGKIKFEKDGRRVMVVAQEAKA